MALCTPNEMLKELQDTNQMSKLMVMNEAVKMLPIGEIWEEYCRRENVCDDFHFYDEIENMRVRCWQTEHSTKYNMK